MDRERSLAAAATEPFRWAVTVQQEWFIAMSEAHHFTGLFPGDYFVHRFDFGGQIVIAYGLVRRIGADGQYHVDYQAQQPPFQPVTIQNGAHRVIGRISKRAYRLAQMRHWPNSESGVIAIVDYSAGKPISLSLSERLRLLFVY